MGHMALEAGQGRNKGNIVLVKYLRYVTVEQSDRKLILSILKDLSVAPYQIVSTHYCHPSSICENIILPASMKLIGKKNRLRGRVHKGTDNAVLAELEKFGIPKEILPRRMGGLTMLKPVVACAKPL